MLNLSEREVHAMTRKFRVISLAHKIIETVFRDAEIILLTDYLEHDSTISGAHYAELIRISLCAKKQRHGQLHDAACCFTRTARQHTLHLQQSSGYHQECRVRTIPLPTVLDRSGTIKRLQFVSKAEKA